MFYEALGVEDIVLVKTDGSRATGRAHVQSKLVMARKNLPANAGDVIERTLPGGQLQQLEIVAVDYFAIPEPHLQLKVRELVKARQQIREAPVKRLGLEALHPSILEASSNLFTDGHLSDAVFNAFKAVEVRVRKMSGLDLTGVDLMAQAFSESNPKLNVAIEEGLSGESEQRGFKFLFMGAIAGIRNPKGHTFVKQHDPQRALEYLAFASLLMRRLDDVPNV